jgi:nucleoside-diphosphate-sugar epimerase
LTRKIGILGCGWLGLPLAKSFVSDRYGVHGSTTSEEKLDFLKKEGIVPFLLSVNEDGIQGDISGFLKDIEVLIVNVPPKLRGGGGENYVKKMESVHREVKLNGVKKIIFVSSTSVYGSVNGEVTEETVPEPNTESGKQLLSAEKIFFEDKELQSTIIRFGGLIGPDRHPVTMLSGRKDLSNGNAPVNLIHLNDCIGIIISVFENSWWNEVLNGVYPHHPTKHDYYTTAAKKRNLQAPDYKEDTTYKGKIVIPKVLLNVKKYQFTTSL